MRNVLKRSALIVAGFLALTGVTIPNASANALGWKDCGGSLSGMQCGDISVPSDWRQSSSARTSIGLAKIPAKDPDHKLGSLVVNTGGPAVTIDPGLKSIFGELTKWFDVVAFDPRGFGRSSGITCPIAAPNYMRPIESVTPRAWQQYAKDSRAYGRSCKNVAGPLNGRMDSWQVAHDMDAIRSALGDAKLNYWANSYGTVYGQEYAELFPDKVHRMYLDSVLDHTDGSLTHWTRPMSNMMEDQLHRFADWCRADSSCALHGQDALAVWDTLIAKATRQPLPAPGAGTDKTVDADLLRAHTLVSHQVDWAWTASALAKAQAGDATEFYGPSGPLPQDNSVSNVAYCADFPLRTGYRGMTVVDAKLRQSAPRIGWFLARFNIGRCAGLAAKATNPPHRIHPTGLPPILLADGIHDLATPPAHGRSVAAQLPGAVWIGADTEHAVYIGGNRCVRDKVNKYLTTGAMPPANEICPA